MHGSQASTSCARRFVSRHPARQRRPGHLLSCRRPLAKVRRVRQHSQPTHLWSSRGAGHPAPPSQIRTCSFPASGSSGEILMRLPGTTPARVASSFTRIRLDGRLPRPCVRTRPRSAEFPTCRGLPSGRLVAFAAIDSTTPRSAIRTHPAHRLRFSLGEYTLHLFREAHARTSQVPTASVRT